MKDAYETSTRDICSPVPTVDAEIIALADGSGFAVAVNVYPLPGQPVGILWFRDGGTAAYAFPFGPGEKTVWLQPGQLAMLMVPEIRRMAIAGLRVLQREASALFSDFEIYVADDKLDAARVTYHKV